MSQKSTVTKNCDDSKELVRTDRCVNPLGFDNHIGKALRKISKRLIEKFPYLSVNSRVCKKCVNMCNKGDDSNSMDTTLSQASEESDTENEPSPKKVKIMSREDELEELLNGLKEKFNSLPQSDPLRLSILTIVPDSWSIRKISQEFSTSQRMARKSKI